MIVDGEIGRTARHRWYTMPDAHPGDEVVAACDATRLAEQLADLDGVSVVDATINRTGRITVPEHQLGDMTMPAYDVGDLPDHCEVVLRRAGGTSTDVTFTVWVPLVWNGRLLGVGGAGNRTIISPLPTDDLRQASLPVAIRNGFVGVATDAGVGDDPRTTDWQLDESTRELDAELIDNWVHRSTHEAAVVGARVAQAVHGQAPTFSYFQGTSGGGRQAVAQVQRHPEDYDGVWAADPAINWTRFIPAELWPAVVMNAHGTALSPAKLAAINTAVRAAGQGPEVPKGGPGSSTPAPSSGWRPRTARSPRPRPRPSVSSGTGRAMPTGRDCGSGCTPVSSRGVTTPSASGWR